MTTQSDGLTRAFLDFSRQKLRDELWPRTCTCLDKLSGDQIWWRPNEQSNSIGNLLLHLNGNVRQWIVSPLGNVPDNRDRDSEFAEGRHIGLSNLRAALDQTVKEFDSILGRLTAADLLKDYTIQGFENVTALEAIYHVIEHFAMHYGQMVYVTKLLTETDLGFYKHLSGPSHSAAPQTT
jgi:uncharacterized damage-inducible protein DinB